MEKGRDSGRFGCWANLFGAGALHGVENTLGGEPTNLISGEEAGEARLPERTGVVLRAMYGAGLEVPADVDGAVMAEAGRRLGRRGAPTAQGSGRWYGWQGWVGLAAAAIVVGVTVWMVRERVAGSTDRSGQRSVARAGDFNGDGRVDVLDALWLARGLEAKSTEVSGAETSVARCDVNHDGRVDRKDVDAVAMVAVKIGGGA